MPTERDELSFLQRPLTRRQVLHIGGGMALVLGAGPVLAACGGDGEEAGGQATATAPEAVGGGGTGTLTVAIPNDIGGWDFDYIAFNLVGIMVLKNTYPFAIDYGVREIEGAQVHDTDNFVPVFAESWEPNDDGTVWTLKLREGLTFPRTGNEITAEDIKWSKDRAFEAQANVAGIYRLIGLTEPGQVEVVDDYTVRFTHDVPSAIATQIHIISLFFYDSTEAKNHVTDDDPWAREWVDSNPQDGGYYNVQSYTAGQEVVLEANENLPVDQPAVKTVRLPIIPAAATRRLQLEQGDIDVALGLSRRDIQDLKETEGVKVLSVPGNELTAVPLNVEMAPLDDVRVRQALAYAVPYDQIVQSVYFGDARAARSIVPLDMPGHIDAYPYTYDLERARSLLEEAGQGGGFEAEIAVEANNDEQQQIAILLQNEFEKLGVRLNITQLDPATFGERRQAKDIPMQVTVGQWWVNDVEYELAVSFTEGAFLNYANWIHPRVEEVFAEFRGLTDEARRTELAAEVQQIAAEEVPWLLLAQPNFNVPVREHVEGWVQPVDGLARFYYLSTSE